MRFKLIVALVEDDLTDDVLKAARDAGATGATVINNARAKDSKKHAASLAWKSPLSGTCSCS